MNKELSTARTNYHNKSFYQDIIQEISYDDLKQVFTILNQQTFQNCKVIKQILFDQMQFQILPSPNVQLIEPSFNHLKPIINILNQDIKKIISLLKIFIIDRNHLIKNKPQNQNDNLILKIAMLVKQLGYAIQHLEQNKEFKKVASQSNFLNITSIYQNLRKNVFRFESQKQQTNAILKQINKKMESIYQQVQTNIEQKKKKANQQIHIEKYLNQIEELKNQNNKITELYEEQIKSLRECNMKLQQQLTKKLQSIEKNNQEYITYIKKYNNYVQKLRAKNFEQQKKIIDMQQDNDYLKQLNTKLRKLNQQYHESNKNIIGRKIENEKDFTDSKQTKKSQNKRFITPSK